MAVSVQFGLDRNQCEADLQHCSQGHMTGYYGPWGRTMNWTTRSSPATPTRATPTRSAGDTPFTTANTPVVLSPAASPFAAQMQATFPPANRSAPRFSALPSRNARHSSISRALSDMPSASVHSPNSSQNSPAQSPIGTRVPPISIQNGCSNNGCLHNDNCNSRNDYNNLSLLCSTHTSPLQHCAINVGPPDESQAIEIMHTATTKHYVASMSQTVGEVFRQHSTSTETITEGEDSIIESNHSSPASTLPLSPSPHKSWTRSPAQSPQVLLQRPHYPPDIPMHQYVLHQMHKPPPLYQDQPLQSPFTYHNTQVYGYPEILNVPRSEKSSHNDLNGNETKLVNISDDIRRPERISENQYISRAGSATSRSECVPYTHSSSSINSNLSRRSRSSTPGTPSQVNNRGTFGSIYEPNEGYFNQHGEARRRRQDHVQFEPVRIAPPPPVSYMRPNNTCVTSSYHPSSMNYPSSPSEVACALPTVPSTTVEHNSSSRRQLGTPPLPSGGTKKSAGNPPSASSGAKHVASLHFVPTPLHSTHLLVCPPVDKGSIEMSDRSYTSVNLRLRQPSSDPQPAIDIKSSGSCLTYSTSSLDRRQGSRSSLQISIGPSGGSISAMRTNLSTEVNRSGNTAFHIQYRAGDGDEEHQATGLIDGDNSVSTANVETSIPSDHCKNISNNSNVYPPPKMVYRSNNGRRSRPTQTSVVAQPERPRTWYVPPAPSSHPTAADYYSNEQCRRNSLPVNSRFFPHYHREEEELDERRRQNHGSDFAGSDAAGWNVPDAYYVQGGGYWLTVNITCRNMNFSWPCKFATNSQLLCFPHHVDTTHQFRFHVTMFFFFCCALIFHCIFNNLTTKLLQVKM